MRRTACGFLTGSLLGHTFDVDRDWPNRLVRAAGGLDHLTSDLRTLTLDIASPPGRPWDAVTWPIYAMQKR